MSHPDRQTAERIALQALGWTPGDARGQAPLFDRVVAAILLAVEAERECVAGWLEHETHGIISRGTAAMLAETVRKRC